MAEQHTPFISTIARAWSEDLQTEINLWQDGSLTLGQTVNSEGEHEQEVYLPRQMVQRLLDLLQRPEAQAVIEPAPKQAE